jgi:hypothetical protein
MAENIEDLSRELMILRSRIDLLEMELESAQEEKFPEPVISAPASGLDWDLFYYGVQKVTIDPDSKTTNYLKIWHDPAHSPRYEWVEALPDEQDADATVFDVTRNRIYLGGEVAG